MSDSLITWPDNIVADRHEVTGKWVLWYLTDEQAKLCSTIMGDASVGNDEGDTGKNGATTSPATSESSVPKDGGEWLTKIRKAIHYPECWDTIAYPNIWTAIWEIAGCVGCSECQHPGENPDADQKPTKPVKVSLDQIVSSAGRRSFAATLCNGKNPEWRDTVKFVLESLKQQGVHISYDDK